MHRPKAFRKEDQVYAKPECTTACYFSAAPHAGTGKIQNEDASGEKIEKVKVHHAKAQAMYEKTMPPEKKEKVKVQNAKAGAKIQKIQCLQRKKRK